MIRARRLIAASVLISLAGVLAGCSGGISSFDPTDLLDFMDTKKKLPGDRKPVFPEGVPGLEQGVPKELYKGSVEEQQQQQQAAAAAEAPKAEPEPKPKKTRRAAKPHAAPAAATSAEPAADGEAAPAPAPKPAKRQRASAPAQAPAQDQQAAPAQQSAFPAPLPSGSFNH